MSRERVGPVLEHAPEAQLEAVLFQQLFHEGVKGLAVALRRAGPIGVLHGGGFASEPRLQSLANVRLEVQVFHVYRPHTRRGERAE